MKTLMYEHFVKPKYISVISILLPAAVGSRYVAYIGSVISLISLICVYTIYIYIYIYIFVATLIHV